MIAGLFGDNGELLFEIQLVAANNKKFLLQLYSILGLQMGG
ncbi:MAG: hypothetical protein V7K47_22830 [Nostoc sp.]